MKRRLSLVLLLVLAAAIFGACSSSSKPTASKGDSVSGSSPASQAPASDSAKPTAPPGQVSNTPIRLADKVIRNASYDIRIKDADQTMTKINQAITASGGYVQQTSQTGTKQQGRTTNMIVRIPAGQYAAVTDFIRGLGEVTQPKEWTENVTEQYVDLTARIGTEEIHLTQLNKLYDRSGTVKEMMDLEQEISRVQGNLESLKGKVRVLSDRVEFSTITINLYELGDSAPLAPPKTVWERMTRGFTESWHGVVNFTGDLVVLFVTALPVLVYMAAAGGVIYLIVRGIQKVTNRRRPPPPPYSPPPEPPQQQ